MSNIEPTPGWTLVRTPDDVPTPVAVAAADFCRRAGRPSTAEEVRLALARLEAGADERVLEIARVDPPARPLGPEALVDLALGLEPEEAAERELQGYYLAMSRAPRVPAAGSRGGRPGGEAVKRRGTRKAADAVDASRLLGAYREHRGSATGAAASLNMTVDQLEERTRKLSLVRRVAALKAGLGGAVPPRIRSSPPPPQPRHVLTPPAQLPKRGSGRPPMGRMAQGKTERRRLSELQGSSGREELLQLLRAHPGNRGALLKRLNLGFTSTRGEIDGEQLQSLIAAQGLEPEARRLERERLRDLVVRNRGDLRAMGKGLHLARAAVVEQLKEHGLFAGAEALRGKLRREIQERSLEGRMKVVLKSASYLQELEALGEVLQGLAREIAQRFPDLPKLASRAQVERLAQGLKIPPATALELLEVLPLRSGEPAGRK